MTNTFFADAPPGGTRLAPVGAMSDGRPAAFTPNNIIPTKRSILERRAMAWQLLAGSYSHLRIGLYLHADPTVNTTKVGTPGGYGWKNYLRGRPPLLDKDLRHAVGQDIRLGMEAAAVDEAYKRDEWVLRELNSLATAQAAIWTRVQRGEPRAIEVYLQLATRRAKLLGLDRPEQIEQTNVNVNIDAAQPVYDNAYAAKMFDALREVGALTETTAIDAEDDIPDAEVVE